jgi:beta-glucosidase
MPQLLSFPPAFTWGVAAAAPQIEGAVSVDGKGPSVWDTFAAQPGRVLGGHTLDPACDHYHRFDADFALMASLGIKHYRLSLAWPRLFPDASGVVNPRGLDFYRRLFDSLATHGITPWVTLFHWDLPQWVEDSGGWRTLAAPNAFGVYADTVVRAFRDQVKHWFTLNEIPCFTTLAHSGSLSKAPGTPLSTGEINQTIHHALLAHGHGVRAVREYGGPGAQVGMADVPNGVVPCSETPEDIAAAEAAFAARNDGILGAVQRGAYSSEYLRRCGPNQPRVAAGDFDLISLPTDYLGVNVYFADYVRATPAGGYEVLPFPEGYPASAAATWLKFVPPALYWTPRLCRDVYGAQAIYITENGYGAHEADKSNGEIIDLHRRDYLRQYLKELHRAIQDGVDVRGYFAWSFMDNFEWADGYGCRFGLCHTDYATQKRTPKLSARWYAQVMAENRVH